jgi:hypothetical protein
VRNIPLVISDPFWKKGDKLECGEPKGGGLLLPGVIVSGVPIPLRTQVKPALVKKLSQVEFPFPPSMS